MRCKRLLTLCLVLTFACSSNSDTDSFAAADDATGVDMANQADTDTNVCVPARTIGQPCSDDCECLGGICALNEWAPFRFCTRDCGSVTSGSLCPAEPGMANPNSLCVQLPSTLDVEPKRFCAPLCNQGPLDCKATGNPWDKCGSPEYLGQPLHSTSDLVCLAPSAHGHEPIDPDTCDNYEALFTNDETVPEVCFTYCRYLQACNYVSNTTATKCCSWRCSEYVMPGISPDKDKFDSVTCFGQAFSAFEGSGLVCTKPRETCGGEPVVP